MIGVCTYWPNADWISAHPGGPKRWLSHFIFPMQAFGADTLILVNGPEIGHGYDINFVQYEDMIEVFNKYEKEYLVVLDGKAEKTLQEFEHPQNDIIYFVGNDYGGLNYIYNRLEYIRIDNINNHKNLWSHNCIAIALYDRYLKNGSSK